MFRNKNPVNNTTSTADTLAVFSGNSSNHSANNLAAYGTSTTTTTFPVDRNVIISSPTAETKSNYNNNHTINVHPQSPSNKPTHRRGLSHGSYSTLNPSSGGNLSSTNHQSNSLGRNTLNTSIHFTDPTSSSMIMKSNSNDQVDSSDQHASVTLTPNEETKRVIAQLEQKIRKYKKAIAEEQMKCNENVNEYLKLSSNAQPNQSQRIKTVFEKNNQRSSQKITQYQKKLNRLNQDLENIKNGGIYHRHTRERLRDVGTNIKEGITGISGGVIGGIKSAGETVIIKPQKFFKRSTAESTEKNSLEQEQSSTQIVYDSDYQNTAGGTGVFNSNSHSHSHSTKCTSEDDSSSITSGSGHLGISNSQSNSAYYSSSPLRPMKRYYTVADIDQLRNRLDERTQDCLRFNDEIDQLKNQFQSEVGLLNQTLQDEKYRVERLEEQLNDLTELHQKEIENLKQTISDLEEKIQYQTEERQRDVHEMLESFQTRISRMEHQQHQHLQQLVNLDSLDNSNARALVLKLINVLLTVLQVVLLLVATVANILAPFLQTRARIFTSVFVIIIFTIVFQNWPDLNMWTKQKIYENFIFLLDMIPFISQIISSSSSSSSTNTNNNVT